MKEENLSRRQVLRGALAVGCGLSLPVVLFGCDTKPKETPVLAAAGSSGAPAATKKMTQASVRYQAQPQGDLKCGDCAHFIAASNTCAQVEGEISSSGWCTIWVKRA